jgi:predicted RNase H-like HicB family nuclease
VPELPGVLAYGETAEAAAAKAEILASHVLSEYFDEANRY